MRRRVVALLLLCVLSVLALFLYAQTRLGSATAKPRHVARHALPAAPDQPMTKFDQLFREQPLALP